MPTHASMRAGISPAPVWQYVLTRGFMTLNYSGIRSILSKAPCSNASRYLPARLVAYLAAAWSTRFQVCQLEGRRTGTCYKAKLGVLYRCRTRKRMVLLASSVCLQGCAWLTVAMRVPTCSGHSLVPKHEKHTAYCGPATWQPECLDSVLGHLSVPYRVRKVTSYKTSSIRMYSGRFLGAIQQVKGTQLAPNRTL